MYLKRTEFIATYLENTCVYYILLDNCYIQSCQNEQGKDVAIATRVQSTLCTLGHRAVSGLTRGLDSMWHTSTRGFWSKKNSLISVGVQIARQCFPHTTWSVLPQVPTRWGLSTLCLVFQCCVWINYRIGGSNREVTNNIQEITKVDCYNVYLTKRLVMVHYWWW